MAVVYLYTARDLDLSTIDYLHVSTGAEVVIRSVTDHLVVPDWTTVCSFADHYGHVVTNEWRERARTARSRRISRITHVVRHDVRQVVHRQQFVQLRNRVHRCQTSHTTTKQVRAIGIRQNGVRRLLVHETLR